MSYTYMYPVLHS